MTRRTGRALAIRMGSALAVTVAIAFAPASASAQSRFDRGAVEAVGDPTPYVGTYHSPELDVDYSFASVDGTLRIRIDTAFDEEVVRLSGDTLRAGGLTFRFSRTGGAVSGFELDAGRVVHVRFERSTERR